MKKDKNVKEWFSLILLTAVVVWVLYVDMWPQLCGAYENIPSSFKMLGFSLLLGVLMIIASVLRESKK